jgi:ferrous iron transport protein A
MTLDELKIGQTGTITGVEGEGPAVQRLMSLGLLAGSRIRITRRAIGGDPIEVAIMDYALSLRREEARRVHVVCEI